MCEKNKVTSDIFFVNSVSCVFTFDGNKLQWQDRIVPVEEIISIDFVHRGNCCEKDIKKNWVLNVITKMLWTSPAEHDALIVHYAHALDDNRMRKFSIKFQGETHQVSEWWKMLRESLEKVSRERPKRCLVFINPFSGRRNAIEIYTQTVKPLLEVAEVKTCVMVTKSRCDFRKVIYGGFEDYDAIMALGGDGTISEIINCLLHYQMDSVIPNRGEKDTIVPKIMIPIAIIPCGSTDCIAYSLNGTRDVETNALHAIFGSRCRLDVCGVSSKKGFHKFFVSVFTYGYMSDLVQESEKFRWMGPVRYNYAGVLTLVRSKEYFGCISFHGEECKKQFRFSMQNWNDDYANATTSEGDFRRDGRINLRGNYFLIACANISCSSEMIPNGIAPHCSGRDGYMSLVLFQPTTICDLIKMYTRLTSRERNTHLSDLPFVTTYKTKEVTIDVSEADPEVRNLANCDGELFDNACVTIKVYKEIALFFTRKQWKS